MVDDFTRKCISSIAARGGLDWMPDKEYLKLKYWSLMGTKLNLTEPKRFNEKLQWLKLYDHQSIYTTMVDKYEVKKYVADKIGAEYIIPNYGVWDDFKEINFNTLPDQFVLKCTHDSGGIAICRDKETFDFANAKRKLEKSLKRNYYLLGREWPYKNVKPRIIAEKYMVDNSANELKDYKFFCFDGHVKALFVASDRFTEGEETKFDFYDVNFNHLPFKNGHPNANNAIACPESFEKMKQLAETLSSGIPHVRVDFYEVNNKVYFGEFTFFHWSGMVPFDPDDWDYKFGEWINLPNP